MSIDDIDDIGDLVDLTVCSSCDGTNLVIADGELVCKTCGTVIASIDQSSEPEWRAFSREERERRERTGAPLSESVHDRGLSTVIGKPRAGATQEQKELAARIKKWQKRSRIHSSSDRNLIQAMGELSRLSEKIHTPASIKERAAVIYRRALDKDLVRGRSIAAIVAASLYAACRLTGTPRTLTQVSDHSSVSKKDVARCYRLIIRELGIRMPVPDPRSKLTAIASKIGVKEKTIEIATLILKEAKARKLTAGKDPMGLAAASLYIACQLNNENKTQKAIANAAGVTEVTIRNRYKGLKQALGSTAEYKGLEDIDPRFKEFMSVPPTRG